MNFVLVNYNTVIAMIHKGDIVLKSSSNLVIDGIVLGNISIEDNSHLDAFGIVKGNIILSMGSSANIYGSVDGNIDNYGDLVVYGCVDTINDFSNSLDIKPNSTVNGIRY
jgi:hypothetical protein